MLFLRVSDLKPSRFQLSQLKPTFVGILAIFAIGLASVVLASPVFAHPGSGHSIPQTGFAAFMSGLIHPLTGFDHLAFIVALGLLASTVGRRGLAVPVLVIATVLVGAILPIAGTHLPALETVISASVLGLGLVLAWQRQPNLALIAGCAAIFGIFHGYAYGEFVAGASAGLFAGYYVGLTIAHGILGSLAYGAGQLLRSYRNDEAPNLGLRFAGFAICGVGMTLLSSLLLV